MASFDRSHRSSYWRFTVTTAPSCAISVIFDVKEHRDLEIQVSAWLRYSPLSFTADSVGVLESLLLASSGKNYTVSQKTGPFLFEHNFGKYCPILIILSLL